MTWIYRQGRESQAVPRAGRALRPRDAVLITLPMYLIYYAVQPMPGALVVKQIVFDTIGMVIMGIVAAWINQRDMTCPSTAVETGHRRPPSRTRNSHPRPGAAASSAFV